MIFKEFDAFIVFESPMLAKMEQLLKENYHLNSRVQNIC